MRTTLALIFVALLSISSANAQEPVLSLLAVAYLEDVEGPWEIQYFTLPLGGMLYVETEDGETSKLQIPEGSSVRIIGRALKMMSINPLYEQSNASIFVGDVMISATSTWLVSSRGKAAFNEAQTKLRYKSAAVSLRGVGNQ